MAESLKALGYIKVEGFKIVVAPCSGSLARKNARSARVIGKAVMRI